MVSRRPSSRPSPYRRSSALEAVCTAREINAEKSCQCGAAVKVLKPLKRAEVSTKCQKSVWGAQKDGGAKHSFLRGNRGAERGTSRSSFARLAVKGFSVLPTGGPDVSMRPLVVLIVATVPLVMLVSSLYQRWQQEHELVQIKTQVTEQQ